MREGIAENTGSGSGSGAVGCHTEPCDPDAISDGICDPDEDFTCVCTFENGATDRTPASKGEEGNCKL